MRVMIAEVSEDVAVAGIHELRLAPGEGRVLAAELAEPEDALEDRARGFLRVAALGR